MPETPKREVNADDVEVLDLEDDAAAPEAGEADDLDETVIPPVEDDESELGEETTEEAPAESSPEGAKPVAKAEPKDTASAAPSQQKKEPAPVPGETPREKGLRLEVQRVKSLLRKQNISDVVDGNAPGAPKATVDAVKELQELGYSDEEIKNMEKAVDILARKSGYVKQADNYQGTVNDVVEGFIQANPEYKPENDPEDVRWNKFNEILKGGIYDIKGKNPKQLQQIFARVHKDVIDELGAPEEAPDAAEERKKAAQKQKVKSVNHSGGTKTPVAKPKWTVDPAVRGMFKGFSDEDLE